MIYRHLADPGCLEALLEGRRDPVLGREGHGDKKKRSPRAKIFVMKGENEGSGGGKKKIASSFAVAAQKRTERADFLIPLLRLPHYGGREKNLGKGGQESRRESRVFLHILDGGGGQAEKKGRGKKFAAFASVHLPVKKNAPFA